MTIGPNELDFIDLDWLKEVLILKSPIQQVLSM